MEAISAFGLFELIIFMAGVAWPILKELKSATAKYKSEFRIRVFWLENNWKVFTGIGFSLVALVLLLAVASPEEIGGAVFRVSIFACGYSPNQEVQSTMDRRKI